MLVKNSHLKTKGLRFAIGLDWLLILALRNGALIVPERSLEPLYFLLGLDNASLQLQLVFVVLRGLPPGWVLQQSVPIHIHPHHGALLRTLYFVLRKALVQNVCHDRRPLGRLLVLLRLVQKTRGLLI